MFVFLHSVKGSSLKQIYIWLFCQLLYYFTLLFCQFLTFTCCRLDYFLGWRVNQVQDCLSYKQHANIQLFF